MKLVATLLLLLNVSNAFSSVTCMASIDYKDNHWAGGQSRYSVHCSDGSEYHTSYYAIRVLLVSVSSAKNKLDKALQDLMNSKGMKMVANNIHLYPTSRQCRGWNINQFSCPSIIYKKEGEARNSYCATITTKKTNIGVNTRRVIYDFIISCSNENQEKLSGVEMQEFKSLMSSRGYESIGTTGAYEIFER